MSAGLEDEARHFAPQLEQLRLGTIWVEEVLQSTLDPVTADSTVVCLGVDTAYELLHIRRFTGDTAKIFGYDIALPPPMSVLAVIASGTDFQIRDIRNVDNIVSEIGRKPELVMCRHPQIIQDIDPVSGKILKLNDWWGDALVRWAKACEENGQVLVTTYTHFEQQHLTRIFKDAGIRFTSGSNTFAPDKFVQHKGPHVSRPDSYTIHIRT